MKLKINSDIKSKNVFKNAGLIKFFVDDDSLKTNFQNILKELNLSFSSELQKSFLTEDVNEISTYTGLEYPAHVRFIKIKIDEKLTNDFFRETFASQIEDYRTISVQKLIIEIPKKEELSEIFPNSSFISQSIIEGIYLGDYDFEVYKTKKSSQKKFDIYFNNSQDDNFDKLITETVSLMDAVYFTRDLINEPSNTMTPKELAERTKKKLIPNKIKVTVWNKSQLVKKGMSAVLAVGSSSESEPCFIEMHYKPSKPKKKIVLVGKGVTYDTGGYSIKSTSNMIDMKADMAGGASVIGAVLSAAMNKLPIEIIALVPAVENVISGSAFKPGDIIKSSSGKSIMVSNTDAEGRLILADALEYGNKFKPDFMIDYATLTGACVVALGEIAAGIFSKNQELIDMFKAAGDNTFERIWPLPMWDEYSEMIESDLADIDNTGPRWGGAITAAKFLEFFVDNKKNWAHIDLAGPSLKNKYKSYTKKYDPGFGVRLTYQFLKEIK
ncbi:MAG: leucyl aminopeptidase [Melioribacteraceae bacterium]|nr:leucyl aminopeptidase [Melioribacteraceae bacterium]